MTETRICLSLSAGGEGSSFMVCNGGVRDLSLRPGEVFSFSSARWMELDFAEGRDSFRVGASSGIEEIRIGIWGGLKFRIDMLGLRLGSGLLGGAPVVGRESDADAECETAFWEREDCCGGGA